MSTTLDQTSGVAWISVKEAAVRLGLSTRAIYERIADGRLAAADFGSERRALWRIDEREIERYIAEGQRRGEHRS